MLPESLRTSSFSSPFLLPGHSDYCQADASVTDIETGLKWSRPSAWYAVSRRIVLLILILLAGSCLSACGISRSTTSVRSAVEAALVSKAIRDAVGSISLPEPALSEAPSPTSKLPIQNSFYIQPLSITSANRLNMIVSTEDVRKPIAADDAYNSLLKHMLERGYSLAPSAETARYLIYPTLHYAEVDDNQYTLGIPSIPLPTANLGTVNTPELALLGLHSQFGRAKISVLMVENPTGSYRGTFESPVTQSSYHRWKLLLFFGWRTTTLPKPF